MHVTLSRRGACVIFHFSHCGEGWSVAEFPCKDETQAAIEHRIFGGVLDCVGRYAPKGQVDLWQISRDDLRFVDVIEVGRLVIASGVGSGFGMVNQVARAIHRVVGEYPFTELGRIAGETLRSYVMNDTVRGKA